MSFVEFTSNKNKGVLWGLLQEGGVFDNIPASMFQNVKNIFEMSILSMKREFDIFFDKNDEGDDDYDKKATEMIINSNKSVIKKVIDEVNRIKMQNENSVKQMQAQAQAQQNSLPLHLKPITLTPIPTHIPAVTKKPKIEEIYRADDIKKTRMSELEIRLKEKQAEMDTMLNNKKPEHIDFSDKALGKNRESDLYDKKLAGDEMERLLAETLASRERELEKLNINVGSFRKGVSGGDNDSGGEIPVNKIVPKRLRESKNVTFNDEDNTKMEYEKQEQENGNGNENENGNEDNELSFFSKLKLRTGNSTPLDDIMNNANRNDDEDEDEEEYDEEDEEKERMQLRVQEIGNFSRSRETRETREAGEAGEMQQMQQMREMQRYIILEQRIKVIHDDLNEIKKNQGLILSLLEKKVQ